MNTLPLGIYQEDDKRFEFDFAKHLIRISRHRDSGVSETIVSPFRMIKNEGNLYLLIHNYDRTGDRKIRIESMNKNELVISQDNISYKLKKMA